MGTPPRSKGFGGGQYEGRCTRLSQGYHTKKRSAGELSHEEANCGSVITRLSRGTAWWEAPAMADEAAPLPAGWSAITYKFAARSARPVGCWGRFFSGKSACLSVGRRQRKPRCARSGALRAAFGQKNAQQHFGQKLQEIAHFCDSELRTAVWPESRVRAHPCSSSVIEVYAPLDTAKTSSPVVCVA